MNSKPIINYSRYHFDHEQNILVQLTLTLLIEELSLITDEVPAKEVGQL